MKKKLVLVSVLFKGRRLSVFVEAPDGVVSELTIRRLVNATGCSTGQTFSVG